MAIQKEKTMNNGSVGNYWRVLSVNIDRQRLTLSGRIALFKDQATSDAGGEPLGCVKVFNFPFTMLEFAAAPNAIAFLYGKVVAYAASTIAFDIDGTPIDPPRPRDADLVGGTDV